ncbi:MAG: hypothetical protein ACXWWC_10040 [Chitinophagaceae bacterium]
MMNFLVIIGKIIKVTEHSPTAMPLLNMACANTIVRVSGGGRNSMSCWKRVIEHAAQS